MGHTIASAFLPRSYCQTYSGYPKVGFLSFDRTAHQTLDTVAFLHPPTFVPANLLDLNPVDYSICSVLQEKVYRSRIDKVDYLKTRLIDDWEHFHQSIVDAAITQSPQFLPPFFPFKH